MTDRRIGLGETSSCRYIGVEPPLEDATAEGIARRLQLPGWIFSGMTFIQTDTIEGSPPYTEFGVDVGDALEHLGRELVDSTVLGLARAIGELLEEQGDTVDIIEGMITTDFEHPIFGEDAEKVRAIAAMVCGYGTVMDEHVSE